MKILVVGSSGAGKSTFARRLHEITGIELVHLDRIYWKPNWVEPSKEEWKKTLEKFLEKDAWIMDGNYGGTLEMRMAKCDTVIMIEKPRTICIYRALKRAFKYKGKTRPDMGAGCDEKIDLKFLWYIWNYPKRNIPRYNALFEKYADKIKIVHLKSDREIEIFLSNLKSNYNLNLL